MRRAVSCVGGTIRWLLIGVVVTVVASPLFESLYLDAAGVIAPGTVTDKRESLTVSRDSWTRHFQLTVAYQPAGSPIQEQASVEVDAATYDGLAVGRAVTVRYMPIRIFRELFIFYTPARLQGQSTWSAASLLAQQALDTVRPTPAGALVTTTGTVRALTSFTQTRPKRGPAEDLWQPYTRVEFQYTAPGFETPLQGADLIDAGSVPRLEVGGPVTIRYLKDNARTAAVAGASYTYRWKNPLGEVGGLGLSILCLAGLAAMGSAGRALAGRLFTRRPPPSASGLP